MNELLFFGHLTLLIALGFGALRLSKEALIALVSFLGVLANVLIIKQTTLFGLTVTCTDAYAVGSLLTLNLLQHYYGKKWAKKAIHISFLCLLALSAFSYIHLLYTPSTFDTAQGAYKHIFVQSPRIALSSLATFYIIQRLDLFLFSFLQKLIAKAPLFVPMIFSLLISQTLDTFLFSFLALYGIVHSILQISMMSLIIKCFAILFMAPLTSLSSIFFKSKEPDVS